METQSPVKARRGFSAMSPEKQREIASRGGKAVHAKGLAHEFTSEEAKIAGAKGGARAQKLKKERAEREADREMKADAAGERDERL